MAGDTLYVENLTFEGDGSFEPAIQIGAPKINVVVDNVTIRGFDQGIVIGTLGCECRIEIKSTRIEGNTMQGPALWVQDMANGAKPRVLLSDIAIEGFNTSIRIERVAAADVSGIFIECGHRGLDLGGFSDFALTSSNIDGCSQGAAIQAENILSIRILDSTVSDSSIGVNTSIVSGAPELVTRNARFVGNGVAIWNSNSQLDVSVSVFESNGNGPNPAPQGMGPGGILSGLAGGIVRDSSFEGNRGLAVHSTAGRIDAAYNWWGSQFGPRVYAGPDAEPVGLGGDAVDASVSWAPFLTSRP